MQTDTKHRLQIQLKSTQGVVLRTIGTIERRGFRLLSCTVYEAQGDGQAMAVLVSSTRSGELLKRQLERLHDVLWVELKPTGLKWAEEAEIESITWSA